MAQCTARTKNGTGRCKQPAIRGANVCRMHGGSAPQVRRAAAMRLAALVDPAIGVLDKRLRDKKNPALALKAAIDVLDRNDFKEAVKIYLSGPADGPLEIKPDLSGLTPDELALYQQLTAAVAKTRLGKSESGAGDSE